MCLDTEVIEDGKSVRVEVPPTRADILLQYTVFVFTQQNFLSITFYLCYTINHGFENNYI